MLTYKNIKNYSFLIIGFLLIIATIIPKGAWSYFNDVETIDKAISVGILNYELYEEPGSDLSLTNLYPDKDSSQSIKFTIKNTGTLSINHLNLYTELYPVKKQNRVAEKINKVMMETLDENKSPIESSTVTGNGVRIDKDSFAEQFQVEFWAKVGDKDELLNINEEMTLEDLARLSEEKSPVDLSKWFTERGLELESFLKEGLKITIKIYFIDNGVKQTQFQDYLLPVEFTTEGLS